MSAAGLEGEPVRNLLARMKAAEAEINTCTIQLHEQGLRVDVDLESGGHVFATEPLPPRVRTKAYRAL